LDSVIVRLHTSLIIGLYYLYKQFGEVLTYMYYYEYV